jgi:hypothetical protein
MILGWWLGLYALSSDPSAAELPPPPLRPCCAFGRDLSVALGPLRAPISLDNAVDVAGLGPSHTRYGSPFEEHNGLLYTCRGGFIDTGHLRASADWTFWLARSLHQDRLAIELPPASGALRLTLHPTPHDGDPRILRRRIAARVAYELALWHEVLSFYAPTQFEAFGEAFSTFSPEDLYSDALGALLAAQVLAGTSSTTFDETLRSTLVQLGAVPRPATKAAIDAVAGLFWDPRATVPDGALLLRHHLGGESLSPWRLIDGAVAGCAPAGPITVELPSQTESGAPLGDRYVLELLVPEVLVSRWGKQLTQADLPRLVAEVGQALEAQKGKEALRWPPDDRIFDPPNAGQLALQPEAPRRTSDLEAIRLLPLELFGAFDLAHNQGRPGAGLRVTGGALESRGGDLAFMRMTLAHLGDPSGLVVHLVGLESRALWFGEARDQGTPVAPIAALFRDVAEGAVFGVGGKLFQLQLDTATGRRVIRPLEANLSLNLLGNGLEESYLFRQLVLSTGLSIDDHKPAQGPSDTSLRGQLLLFGTLRSRDLGFELSGFLGLRQDLFEASDRNLEGGLRLGRRFLVRGDGEVLEAMFGLFVEGAYQRWGEPNAQLADWVLALGSRNAKESAHLSVVLTFSDERLGF